LPNVSFNARADACNAICSFGHNLILDVLQHAAASDNARHAQANVTNIVRALDERRHWKQSLLVQQHGMNHVANRYANSPARRRPFS